MNGANIPTGVSGAANVQGSAQDNLKEKDKTSQAINNHYSTSNVASGGKVYDHGVCSSCPRLH